MLWLFSCVFTFCTLTGLGNNDKNYHCRSKEKAISFHLIWNLACGWSACSFPVTFFAPRFHLFQHFFQSMCVAWVGMVHVHGNFCACKWPTCLYSMFDNVWIHFKIHCTPIQIAIVQSTWPRPTHLHITIFHNFIFLIYYDYVFIYITSWYKYIQQVFRKFCFYAFLKVLLKIQKNFPIPLSFVHFYRF